MEQSAEAVAPGWQSHDAERAYLVHLCTYFVDDPIAAEDLAQETLFLAWQRGHQLRDPSRRDAWLKAIARNLCRHWLRDRKPQLAPEASHRIDDSSESADDPDLPDEFDLEIELERDELAGLLDRAMALLPPETRQVLIARYFEDSPQAETARRLGLNEGTVAMRLQRGKLALRRILTSAFPDEVSAYAPLSLNEGESWQTTRIWCPQCGQRRVEGIFVRKLGLFRLRCPSCGSHNDTLDPKMLVAARGYREATSALFDWVDWLYHVRLVQPTTRCHGCGKTVVLHKSTRSGTGPQAYRDILSYRCRCCPARTINSQFINLLALPETRRFQQHHPRMRYLPEREVEAAGRAAVVTGFESMTGRSRIEIVYARDTFDVIQIHSDGIRA